MPHVEYTVTCVSYLCGGTDSRTVAGPVFYDVVVHVNVGVTDTWLCLSVVMEIVVM